MDGKRLFKYSQETVQILTGVASMNNVIDPELFSFDLEELLSKM